MTARNNADLTEAEEILSSLRDLRPVARQPNDESLGYSRWSLRDELQTRAGALDTKFMPFPIAPIEIAKTEAKTGFEFPLGLKSRFAKNNGGEIQLGEDCWQLIPFLDSTDRKRLARTCNDIVRETAKMREWRGFPADAFVIAQNGGGDYLIVRPAAEGSTELGETIYFWDHETREHEPVVESLDSL